MSRSKSRERAVGDSGKDEAQTLLEAFFKLAPKQRESLLSHVYSELLNDEQRSQAFFLQNAGSLWQYMRRGDLADVKSSPAMLIFTSAIKSHLQEANSYKFRNIAGSDSEKDLLYSRLMLNKDAMDNVRAFQDQVRVGKVGHVKRLPVQ